MAADNWEINTFIVLNLKRRFLKVPELNWDNKLEDEARTYVNSVKNNDWEQIGAWRRGPQGGLENVPQWVQDAQASVSLPENACPYDTYSITVSDNNHEYMHEFERDGGIYYRRPVKPHSKTFDLTSNKKWGFRHMISACICAHWTSPEDIADLLWNEHITKSRFKYGAVTIRNDQRYTYVGLACK
ncbi:hypothetical protein [Dehalococcoides mccartyi]|jgi:hypothetical protein|uniref:Uncharacterized protein n=1 Tax=Dehalococcoides mccartyi TaxID=61435 RepID=A0A0V8M0K2_9CHLR|nr:hypothetical protein [Dehalococcoides mccartyi]KSV17303.1 hypothetical protein DA01_07695 [Dehalococcoides mccartyi]